MIRSFLILLTCLLLFPDAWAQRVKRKGVEPMDVGRKKSAKQSNYQLDQLQGRWQEIRRSPQDNSSALAFTDSLLIRIDGKKGEVRDATSMRIGLIGEAQLEPDNMLSIAADIFEIKYLDKEKLILDDGEFLRVLQKKEIFYHETVGKTPVQAEAIGEPVAINIEQLMGKWLIYRRQAEAGIRDEARMLIKSFEIKEIISGNKASGEIAFFSNDITETATCTFIFSNGNMTLETDKHNWVFMTYKADGQEFIFGEKGRFMYYAKH